MSAVLTIVPLPSISKPFDVEVLAWEIRDGCLVAVIEQDGLRARTFMPLENLVSFKQVLGYVGSGV